MKVIIVRSDGRYTYHGIGYTEHDGYAGTADNRWPLKMAITKELQAIRPGEQYKVRVNGKETGPFIK